MWCKNENCSEILERPTDKETGLCWICRGEENEKEDSCKSAQY